MHARREPGPRSAWAALDRGAWDAAREAFETALSVDASNPEALEGLGWALYWLDRTDESLASREQAFRAYRERGARGDAARVALALAVDCVDLRGEAQATGWLERGRRLLDGAEPCVEHGWLALWEGHFALHFRRDVATARRNAVTAADCARRAGQFELEMLAVALEGLVLVAEGEVARGMRCLDEATAAALAGEMRQLDAVGATCCLLVHACERVRDYERAAQWAERVERFSQTWGIAPAFTVCRTQYAAMLIGRGEWAKAEAELTRAAERLAASRPLLLVESLEQLGELRRRQGRWDEAEQLFARAEGRSLPLLGRAALAVDQGEPASAADLLERFLRRTPPDNWSGRAAALELLVRVRLQLGQEDEARSAAERLRALAERLGSPSLRAVALVADGLALEAGDLCEDARRALEDAIDLFTSTEAPFEAARARLDLARCLAALGRGGPARQEARAALESFERLGAAREAFRAAQLLDRLAAPPPAAPGTPSDTAGLSPREVEVLRLVAAGLSDKQIAERLHLSGHTIHRHVSNIRTKLGLPSRAAAVAWAAQHRLL